MRPGAKLTFGSLPLHFEQVGDALGGQTRFLSRGSGYALSISANDVTLAMRAASAAPEGPSADEAGKVSDTARAPVPGRLGAARDSWRTPESSASVLRLNLVGANPEAQLSGRDELSGKVNHLTGDASRWRPDLPTYRVVEVREAYPGIDLVYYGNQRQLEFDFIVAPGADPNAIELAFHGTDRVEITPDGELLLRTAAGEVRQHKPLIYQVIEGARQEVAGGYVLEQDFAAAALGEASARVRFDVASYDVSQPLLIDPVLTYSTAIGGASADNAWDVAVDAEGNTYVAGTTLSMGFPLAAAFQGEFAGGAIDGDIFVLKLNPTGDQLIYSTYLGGHGDDAAFALAVDAAGNAYVTGLTTSTNFPTATARQPAISGQPPVGLETYPFDAIVAKLNPAGSALVYSTYLGGAGDDQGIDIVVDAAGNAYVTGQTTSSDFPTANALAAQTAGGVDAFVSKFSPDGATLAFSTYLGGRGNDYGEGIAVDPLGSTYIAGITSSTDFPQRGGFQTEYNGAFDAFVTKLSAAGNELVYSTFLGGDADDQAFRLALDAGNNAYVTGQTLSANFPTLGAAQAASGGSVDSFVAKLDAAGAALVYSTYLGGSSIDEGWDLTVDALGRAWVAGRTSSTDFPVTPDAAQAASGGLDDAFLAALSADGSALVFSTYLGGSSADHAFALDVDPAGNVYVAGQTTSADFPSLMPLQPTAADGVADGFVARFGAEARLTATLLGGQIKLAWPAALIGFVAETTPTLGDGAAWTEISSPPVTEGTMKTVTVDAAAGSQFFRLRRP